MGASDPPAERVGTARHDFADPVRRLQRLARALATATSPADVAAITVAVALAEAGSAFGGLWLPDKTDLVAAAVHWLADDPPSWFARFPIGADLPASEVYRTGTPMWLTDPGAAHARYPRIGALAYFVLPLVGTEGVLGVFTGDLSGREATE